MSQFDKISFASQIFWFCSFFFVAYFLLLRFVLPRIYTTLKVREWRLTRLEHEVKHAENILLVWSTIVNSSVYRGSIVSLNEFLSVLSSRRLMYVELSKHLMFSELSNKVNSSNFFVSKASDVLTRQRLVSMLSDKK